MTLEKEIYSIETANINKETLDAMQNAGKAMKQIHAGLDIGKVDDVMYVYHSLLQFRYTNAATGNLSANNTPSVKKSAKPSPQALLPAASTKTNSTRNSQNYNRRS